MQIEAFWGSQLWAEINFQWKAHGRTWPLLWRYQYSNPHTIISAIKFGLHLCIWALRYLRLAVFTFVKTMFEKRTQQHSCVPISYRKSLHPLPTAYIQIDHQRFLTPLPNSRVVEVAFEFEMLINFYEPQVFANPPKFISCFLCCHTCFKVWAGVIVHYSMPIFIQIFLLEIIFQISLDGPQYWDGLRFPTQSPYS